MSGPHAKGHVIGSRYEVSDFIGEGGMQFVYSAHDRILNRNVVLKTPKNKSAEKRFHRSAEVSARINHPNVAKTLDYLEEGDRPYLVEEFVDGADIDKALLKKLKYLDPYLAARVFHYLAKGLAASHHAGVIHRDLKPTNVMVSGGIFVSAVKITDFGIAKMAGEVIAEAAEGGDASITSSQTAVGALPYMAPEAIETPRDVGTGADVWSVGAMMFELLAGARPYGTGLKAVQKILEAAPPQFPAFITSNAQFSALARAVMEIILKCLNKNPAERPTADQIVGLCSNLCYPVAERKIGTIKNIKYHSWGFISSDSDVFFHLNSVYGERPAVGDRVLFSQFPGGGANRAHPVTKLFE